MGDAPGDPHWDKLPYDAEGFFELEDGFDRKDLKRAYNRLLKKFKPEKCPQEFQRIRQAFEQLDNQLRYGAGVSAQDTLIQQYSWQVPETAGAPPDAEAGKPSARSAPRESASPRSKAAEQSRTTPLHERVALESPEALYAELKRQAEKRPYHYFALAVLSDAVEGGNPLDFVKWLLAGLKRTPRDPALFHLLYAAFRGPINDQDLAGLILATSTVIRDDRFYWLTEPLWDQLLRAAPFEKFKKLLAKCEGNLSDHQLARKLTFYVHILKPALWMTDQAWIARAFSLLEKHHQELPPDLAFDVEVLYQLRDYVSHREKFVSAHPLRGMLDGTIRAYCTGTPLEAEQAFVACQLKLTTSGPDLLPAFPLMEDSPAFAAFASLWQLLSGEFSDRVARPDDEPTQRFGIRQVLMEIDAKTHRTLLGKVWNWSGWCYGIGRFLLYPLIYVLLHFAIVFTLDDDSSARTPLIFVCLALAGVAGWAFNTYAAEKLWRNWCLSRGRLCYQRIWRRELQQVLSRTMLPYRQLLERMSRVKDSEGEIEYRDWVLAFASHDFGLMVFSYAQLFVA